MIVNYYRRNIAPEIVPNIKKEERAVKEDQEKEQKEGGVARNEIIFVYLNNKSISLMYILWA